MKNYEKEILERRDEILKQNPEYNGLVANKNFVSRLYKNAFEHYTDDKKTVLSFYTTFDFLNMKEFCDNYRREEFYAKSKKDKEKLLEKRPKYNAYCRALKAKDAYEARMHMLGVKSINDLNKTIRKIEQDAMERATAEFELIAQFEDKDDEKE